MERSSLVTGLLINWGTGGHISTKNPSISVLLLGGLIDILIEQGRVVWMRNLFCFFTFKKFHLQVVFMDIRYVMSLKWGVSITQNYWLTYVMLSYFEFESSCYLFIEKCTKKIPIIKVVTTPPFHVKVGEHSIGHDGHGYVPREVGESQVCRLRAVAKNAKHDLLFLDPEFFGRDCFMGLQLISISNSES